MTLRICNGCKKPFIPVEGKNGQNATSCSFKCARKATKKQYPTYIKKQTCKTCGIEKEIKEFGFCGAGKHKKKENCLMCSPSPSTYNNGTSKRFKNKKDYVEIKEAYMPSKTELVKSVLRITDKEQMIVENKD